MTESAEKSGIASDMSGFVLGLTLIIWSLELAILIGLDTTGLYDSMLVFVFLFPPVGSYLLLSGALNILKVVSKEKQ